MTKADCPEPASIEQRQMSSEQHRYRSHTASCLYFSTWTRPDITFAVGKHCKFMHNPGKTHQVSLKRLVRYLNGTKNLGLLYDFSQQKDKGRHCNLSSVYGYYDASWGDDHDTRRSTMGYGFYYKGCLISWISKLHSFITTSTNHSEYCAGAKAAREAIHLLQLAGELRLKDLKRIDVFSDSRGSIAMSYNPTHRAASKHVDLADHYVREQVELGRIAVHYVRSADQIADIFTKPLGPKPFLHHRSQLVSPDPFEATTQSGKTFRT